MLRKLTLLLSALTLAALAATGCAGATPAAETAEGTNEAAASSEAGATEAAAAAFQEMSWTEVEAAMAQGAVLVDARSADGFAQGHITGAVNGDPKDEAMLKAALPADTATQLIFYCGGPQCSASTKAAELAASWGYAKVAEYKGGYPEWSAAQGAQPEAESDPQATN